MAIPLMVGPWAYRRTVGTAVLRSSSTGHTAPAGVDLVRRDLVERSLDLARVLRTLLPADADVAGLLALILLLIGGLTVLQQRAGGIHLRFKGA